jgi:serine/threonine protein kinase
MLSKNDIILDSKWVKQDKIASGCFGVVYKGFDQTTQQIIAIKKINTPVCEDGIPVDTLREIVIMKNIEHPNIIRYSKNKNIF